MLTSEKIRALLGQYEVDAQICGDRKVLKLTVEEAMELLVPEEGEMREKRIPPLVHARADVLEAKHHIVEAQTRLHFAQLHNIEPGFREAIQQALSDLEKAKGKLE